MIENSFKTKFEEYAQFTIWLAQAPDGANGKFAVYRVVSRDTETDLQGNVLSTTIVFEVFVADTDSIALMTFVWAFLNEFHKTIDDWDEQLNYIKTSSLQDSYFADENINASTLRVEINF